MDAKTQNLVAASSGAPPSLGNAQEAHVKCRCARDRRYAWKRLGHEEDGVPSEEHQIGMPSRRIVVKGLAWAEIWGTIDRAAAGFGCQWTECLSTPQDRTNRTRYGYQQRGQRQINAKKCPVLELSATRRPPCRAASLFRSSLVPPAGRAMPAMLVEETSVPCEGHVLDDGRRPFLH